MMVGLPASAAAPVAGLRMTVERPHFTCERGGATLSHVVFRPGSEAAGHGVLPCCDGQIGCAQFLSTTTVLRPGRRWHG
ncbi:hypothetical protein [Lichenicoccus sp.]|uniref:hypothetical protein n=1 Tax=Lichenicoccus sp. TaxID=2781899 RepID=UPI003D1012C6